ncbi:MAG: hypothetical protein VX672_05340 [Planctomycetota bacterium]|nr:hypothetical protein [Planctomycetota bacterium]
MPIRSAQPSLAFLVALGIGVPGVDLLAPNACAAPPAPSASPAGWTILPGHPGERDLLEDPIALFERLVDRYRSFRRYAERSEVVRVIRDPGTGDPEVTTRTRVRAEVAGDDLKVDRSNLLRRAHDVVASTDSSSPAAREAELRMLPHLRLRFGDRPLEELRSGDHEPFRAAEVERVRHEDREFVRVELLSGDAESPDARLRLFIDPERMLVERVEGEEWLPGGIHRQTTVEIEAVEFDDLAPEDDGRSGASHDPRSPRDYEPPTKPSDSIAPRGRS